MKAFSNFQELIDYVPNCLICGKELELHLKGRLPSISPFYKNYNNSTLHFHLKMKDELLIGKWKKHSITINPVNNQIILGKELINDLTMNWISVLKKCQTCRCSITTKRTEGAKGNNKNFPSLTLTNEEIYYTRKRAKSIGIVQNHYDSDLFSVRTYIFIGGKQIPPLYIDFNKFKNLDHLNERVSTILTFS